MEIQRSLKYRQEDSHRPPQQRKTLSNSSWTAAETQKQKSYKNNAGTRVHLRSVSKDQTRFFVCLSYKYSNAQY